MSWPCWRCGAPLTTTGDKGRPYIFAAVKDQIGNPVRVHIRCEEERPSAPADLSGPRLEQFYIRPDED